MTSDHQSKSRLLQKCRLGIVSTLLLTSFLLASLGFTPIFAPTSSLPSPVEAADDTTIFSENFDSTNVAYPATFGFDSLTALPLGWADGSGVGCSATLIDALAGHAGIVQLHDGNGNYAALQYAAPSLMTSNIEYWVYPGTYTYWGLYGGGKTVTYGYMQPGENMHINTQGDEWYTVCTGITSRWYQLSFSFNWNTHQVTVAVDDLVRGTWPFRDTTASCWTLLILATNGAATGDSYIDAVGLTTVDNLVHPATFGFDNLADLPSGWADVSGTGCSAPLKDNFAGRASVVWLQDGSGNVANLQYTGLSRTNDIEYWVYPGTYTYWGLYGGGKTVTYGYMQPGENMHINTQGDEWYTVCTGITPQWYHLRFSFNWNAHQVTVAVDDVVRGTWSFRDITASYWNQLNLHTNWAAMGNSYIDAVGLIGYDNYDKGDNLGKFLYPATFGFDSLTALPSLWADGSGTGCSATLNDAQAGHAGVVQLHDGSDSVAILQYTATSSMTKDIEYWVNPGTYTYWNVKDGSGKTVTYGYMQPGANMQINTPLEEWYTVCTGITSRWYHLQFSFDWTAKTVKVAVNGGDQGEWPFKDNTASGGWKQLILHTNWAATGDSYIDAVGIIGYDNYAKGDNFGRFLYPSTFGFDSPPALPSGWADVSGTGCSAPSIGTHNGHAGVVQLQDVNGNIATLQYNAPSFMTSSIEYWVAPGTFTYWNVKDGDGKTVTYGYLKAGDNMWINTQGDGWYTVCTGITSRWYNLRFSFNWNAHQVTVAVDGEVQSTWPFRDPTASYWNQLILHTNWGGIGDSYIDAVGLIGADDPTNGWVYPAAFGFDSPPALPSGWADTSGALCSATSIGTHNGHAGVVKLHDGGSSVAILQYAPSSTTNNIEYWVYPGTYTYWGLYGDGKTVTYGYLQPGAGMYINTQGDGWYTVCTGITSRWYHVRFSFDWNTHYVTVAVNDVVQGAWQFRDPTASYWTQLNLHTNWGGTGDSYIDAVVIGNNNYAQGENFGGWGYPTIFGFEDHCIVTEWWADNVDLFHISSKTLELRGSSLYSTCGGASFPALTKGKLEFDLELWNRGADYDTSVSLQTSTGGVLGTILCSFTTSTNTFKAGLQGGALGPTSFTGGTWHHVFLEFDGEDTLTLKVDDIPQAVKIYSGGVAQRLCLETDQLAEEGQQSLIYFDNFRVGSAYPRIPVTATPSTASSGDVVALAYPENTVENPSYTVVPYRNGVPGTPFSGGPTGATYTCVDGGNFDFFVQAKVGSTVIQEGFVHVFVNGLPTLTFSGVTEADFIDQSVKDVKWTITDLYFIGLGAKWEVYHDGELVASDLFVTSPQEVVPTHVLSYGEHSYTCWVTDGYAAASNTQFITVPEYPWYCDTRGTYYSKPYVVTDPTDNLVMLSEIQATGLANQNGEVLYVPGIENQLSFGFGAAISIDPDLHDYYRGGFPELNDYGWYTIDSIIMQISAKYPNGDQIELIHIAPNYNGQVQTQMLAASEDGELPISEGDLLKLIIKIGSTIISYIGPQGKAIGTLLNIFGPLAIDLLPLQGDPIDCDPSYSSQSGYSWSIVFNSMLLDRQTFAFRPYIRYTLPNNLPGIYEFTFSFTTTIGIQGTDITLSKTNSQTFAFNYKANANVFDVSSEGSYGLSAEQTSPVNVGEARVKITNIGNVIQDVNLVGLGAASTKVISPLIDYPVFPGADYQALFPFEVKPSCPLSYQVHVTAKDFLGQIRGESNVMCNIAPWDSRDDLSSSTTWTAINNQGLVSGRGLGYVDIDSYNGADWWAVHNAPYIYRSLPGENFYATVHLAGFSPGGMGWGQHTGMVAFSDVDNVFLWGLFRDTLGTRFINLEIINGGTGYPQYLLGGGVCIQTSAEDVWIGIQKDGTTWSFWYSIEDSWVSLERHWEVGVTPPVQGNIHYKVVNFIPNKIGLFQKEWYAFNGDSKAQFRDYRFACY